MNPLPPPARQRFGQVSLYYHHGAWYTYHRQEGGKQIRVNWGPQRARAAVAASLLNATLVAGGAGITVDRPMAALLATVGGGLQTFGGLAAHPSAQVSIDLACTTTVAGLRQAFLVHHEKILGSSMATVSRYGAATAYLERFAARSQTTAATALDGSAFVEFLRGATVAANGHCARRRLRDCGLRYILETCRSLYRFGLQKQLLPKDFDNPFAALEIGRFKVRDRRPVFVFSPDQELAFLQAADRWDFAVQFTLAKTGMRPGELVHLLIEDVDLEGGWLHVIGKAELGWTIKTGRERQIPLVPELVALLQRVIGDRKGGAVFLRKSRHAAPVPALEGNRRALARAAEKCLAMTRDHAGRPLSRGEEGKVLQRLWRDAGATAEDRVRNSFIRVARRVGLEATCPKSWRHTFATLLQEANAEVLVRQITLGHKPSSMEDSVLGMTGHYTHTTPELQRREIERALRLRPQSLALVQTWLERHEKDREVLP